MAGKKTAEAVETAIKETVEKLGFELVDVEFVKEGANKYLRVYIDRPEGISIDDCVTVNDAVEPIIDELDPISEAYIFEVSSPGLDRPLRTDRDFVKYKGEKVEVGLFKEINESKSLVGLLVGRDDSGNVTVSADGEEIIIDGKNITVIKRCVEF